MRGLEGLGEKDTSMEYLFSVPPKISTYLQNGMITLTVAILYFFKSMKVGRVWKGLCKSKIVILNFSLILLHYPFNKIDQRGKNNFS